MESWVISFLSTSLVALIPYILSLHKEIARLKTIISGHQGNLEFALQQKTLELEAIHLSKKLELEATISGLQEKVNLAGAEQERLKAALAELVKANGELVEQVNEQTVRHEFVEEAGVLFRKSSDEHTECVYCPKCHVALHGSGELSCSICSFVAPFPKGDIDRLVRHLVTSGKISRTKEQLANLPKPPDYTIASIQRPSRLNLDAFLR